MLPNPERPVLLDLFCCAGGAATGYDRAGFDVVGIDLHPQPNYPYPFLQADALAALRTLLAGGTLVFGTRRIRLDDVAAVHASPPCQASSALTRGTNAETRGHLHFNLIPETRELLEQVRAATSGRVRTVIENVQGAEMRRDLTLCGEMFALAVIRHRYFELGGWGTTRPAHIPHRGRVAGWRHGEFFDGPYFAVYGEGGGKGTVDQWQQAMGIFHTADRRELAEAIPPAYTEFVGRSLLASL